MKVNNLDRKDGNSLRKNYTKHDIAESYCKHIFRGANFKVELWGIDKREENSGELTFDDKADLKIYDNNDLVLIIEVKSKSSKDWFGIFNQRHFKDYLKIKKEYNTEVYVYMTLVDEDKKAITKDAYIPIYSEEQVKNVFQAPDGNMVVEMDEDDFVDFRNVLDTIS